MTIPFEVNDGFTQPLFMGHGPIVLVRPMLVADQEYLKRIQTGDGEDVLDCVFSEPHYVGPPKHILLPEQRADVVRSILWKADREREALQEIFDTTVLLFENPGLTRLSCYNCRYFATDHTTGEVLHTPDGVPKIRSPKLAVPCEIPSQGCAKGHWSNPKEPTPLGIRVWRHYWEMKASGLPARCGVMSRNWALIEWVVKYGRDPKYHPRANFPAGGSARDPVRSDHAGFRDAVGAGVGADSVGDVRPPDGATDAEG